MTGPAVSTLFSFDPNTTQYTDTRSYLGLSKFELNQHPVRKYRIIVPAMAALVNTGSTLWQKLAPAAFKGDFATPFSFFLVNLVLMSLLGVVIYRYILQFGIGRFAALLGLLVMLTSRYTADFTGLAMVESLYFLVVACTLSAIRTRNTGMLIACIFVGPFAKEAFVFIAPLIFFFGHINWKKQVLYFLLSGLLVFGFRYGFDLYSHAPVSEGINSDVGYVTRIKENIMSLLSVQGVYQLFMTVGFWIFFIIWAAYPERGKRFLKIDALHLAFMCSVLLQMILSGNFYRMLYMAMPLICLMAAYSFQSISRRIKVADV